jgi:glycosyltransferase involved in cell wall biosynthesis
MKVSIIIPVYNSEKYIKKCLESVINQTYKDKEIFVIYDKSQDHTYEILNEFQNQITVIEKNSGSATRAINDGIDVMTGDWFMYLGSDDILNPDAIEELISEAKKLNNEKCILYSNYNIINSSGEILRKFIEPNYNHLKKIELDVILLDHYFGNFSCSLIHKSLFKKYGLLDEKYALVVDYELWLRFVITFGCKLHLVPKILFNYRQQNESVTQTRVEQCIKEAEELIPQFLSRLDPKIRSDYEQKLNEYKKNKPFKYKIKLIIKNILLLFLPASSRKFFYSKYLSRKSF